MLAVQVARPSSSSSTMAFRGLCCEPGRQQDEDSQDNRSVATALTVSPRPVARRRGQQGGRGLAEPRVPVPSTPIPLTSIMVTCVDCRQQVSIAESKPFSKAGAGKRHCHACNNTRVSICRHSKQKPEIFKGFKKMKPDEKAHYFAEQKAKRAKIVGNPHHTPFDFGDLMGSQTQTKKTR